MRLFGWSTREWSGSECRIFQRDSDELVPLLRRLPLSISLTLGPWPEVVIRLHRASIHWGVTSIQRLGLRFASLRLRFDGWCSASRLDSIWRQAAKATPAAAARPCLRSPREAKRRRGGGQQLAGQAKRVRPRAHEWGEHVQASRQSSRGACGSRQAR